MTGGGGVWKTLWAAEEEMSSDGGFACAAADTPSNRSKRAVSTARGEVRSRQRARAAI